MIVLRFFPRMCDGKNFVLSQEMADLIIHGAMDLGSGIIQVMINSYEMDILALFRPLDM